MFCCANHNNSDLHARVRVSLFIYVCYGHVQHKQLTIAYFACVLKQIFAYFGCVLKHEEH